MRRPAGEKSREPVIVAFMGLDGVGKSTQSEALEAEWAAHGHRPVRVHHASTKVPGLRAIKQRFHGAAVHALEHRGAQNAGVEGKGRQLGRGGAIAWVMSMYFLVGSSLKSLWYPWRSGGKPLILDRCFLDDVVKVRWRLGIDTVLSRILMQAIPKPTVVLVLEGEPAQTFQRKKAPTCTFDQYLEKRRILELTLQEAVGTGWVVERIGIGGRDAESVFTEIIGVLEEHSLTPDWGSTGDDSDPVRQG